MKTKKKHLRGFAISIRDSHDLDHFRVLLTKLGENAVLSWDDSYEEIEPVTRGWAIWDKESKTYCLTKNKPFDRITISGTQL